MSLLDGRISRSFFPRFGTVVRKETSILRKLWVLILALRLADCFLGTAGCREAEPRPLERPIDPIQPVSGELTRPMDSQAHPQCSYEAHRALEREAGQR
jgi:hypothetical protein